jgi:hypothetical protein
MKRKVKNESKEKDGTIEKRETGRGSFEDS